MKIKIRDLRKKSKFVVDDEYLNGYAKVCGVYATAVYISLCRHADKNQECFPSIKLISEEHKIGERTVIRAIKKLEEYKIILREKTRKKNGRWLNNLYFLQDKSEWKNKPSATQAGGIQVPENTEPSAREYNSQVPHRHTKETHIEGNTYKETHISEQSSQENQIIDIFYKSINPTINWGNKSTRKAASDLISRFGLDRTKQFAAAAVAAQGQDYAPTITTPFQLKENLTKLKLFYDRKKKASSSVGYVS